MSGDRGDRRKVVLSIDAKLLDIYTAAAAAAALDRNSVIAAALRVTAAPKNKAALGVAVEMAHGDNGNTGRAERTAESWKQRRRQQRQQREKP